MCLPEGKARVIMADLQRYPLVLSENKQLRVALTTRKLEGVALRRTVTAQDSALAATERQVYFEGLLRKSAEANATVYKLKARKRSWVIVGLSALLLGVTYTAIR